MSAFLSWSERPELEAAAVAAAEDEEKEESGRRSWRSGGAGGAAETEEDRRREERKRRSRWIEADATKTKAMMAEMMRRLGLRDTEEEEEKDDEVVVVVEPRGSVGGKCLRGLSEGEGGGVGLRGGGGDAILVKVVRRRGFAGVL